MRILAGLVIGFMAILTAVHWLPSNHNREQLIVATAIATQGISRPADEARQSHSDWGRTFSPSTSLFIIHPPAKPKPAPAINADTATHSVASTATWATQIFTTASAVAAQVTAPAVRTQSVSAAKVVVAGAVDTTRPTEPERTAPTANLQPKNEDEVYALTRKLQSELKRVGCYSGEIDGDWGPASKRGMALFTARVNATLPVETPDYILLTLVKVHAELACGGGCPTGQLEDDKGRCLPRAVIAQATRLTPETQRPTPVPSPAPTSRSRPANPTVPAAVASAVPVIQRTSAHSATEWGPSAIPTRQVLPGRMSVGAPLPDDRAAPRPSIAPATAAVRTASLPPAETAESEIRRAKTNRRAKSSAQVRRAARSNRSRQAYALRAPSRPSQSPRRYRRSSSWTATFFDRAGASY